MNNQYYDGQQNYPQTPIQNDFHLRNTPSSGSQPSGQALHAQSYHSNVERFDFPTGYDFSQQFGWAQESDVPQVYPSSTANAINIGEINDITSHAHEAPWDGTRARGYTPVNNQAFFPPFSPPNAPKARTVAHGAFSPDVHFRPSFGPRQSYASQPDSGYGSQPTLFDNLTSPSHAKAGDADHVTVGSHESVTDVPPPALSVKTDPTPTRSGKKRRKSKSTVETCPKCNKELKNRSDAQ